MVRVGIEMDSEKAHPSILNPGVEIEALEEGTNVGGTHRVRYAGGWVSKASGAGDLVLEEVGSEESAPAPAMALAPAPAERKLLPADLGARLGGGPRPSCPFHTWGVPLGRGSWKRVL